MLLWLWVAGQAVAAAVPIPGESSDVIPSGENVLLEDHSGKLVFIDGDVALLDFATPTSSQQLVLEKKGGGEISSGDAILLRGPAGNYLDVEGTEVYARWDEDGPVKPFTIQTLEGGPIYGGATVYLRSHTGNYLDAEFNSLAARWKEKSLWQAFIIHYLPNKTASAAVEEPPQEERSVPAPAPAPKVQDVDTSLSLSSLVNSTKAAQRSQGDHGGGDHGGHHDDPHDPGGAPSGGGHGGNNGHGGHGHGQGHGNGSNVSHHGGHDEHHGGHHAHPHDAMLFLFNALIIGTVILHISVLPIFHGLQYTVVLFILGIIYSILQEGAGWKLGLGVLGISYDMWMAISPHLILFTMLPGLLTADAMTIDTAVARKVMWQCFWLAGPIVVINAFLTALFLWVYLPYKWDFLLALTVGAIFAATDPVAVVSLLKELGASPTLTVQIQGEALLNDGSAMVLFLVAYDMLGGETYGVGDVVIALTKLAFAAAALGMFLGRVFAFWIQVASDRVEHHNSLIQISLTICCAYWAYIVAEGVFHVSGILSTVFAAFVLADKIWPAMVDRETCNHVWHVLEHFGNTVIFFLSGAIFGHVACYIPGIDYAHLLAIYAAVLVIRCVLVYASIPVLNRLHPDGQPVTWKDAAVMWWGGLRGALGLTLALQVYTEKANGHMDQMTANRVLFYVGGVATLTLIVNAPLSPPLVKFLGITKTPKAGLRLMRSVCVQLEDIVQNDEGDAASKVVLQKTMHDLAHHIKMDGPEFPVPDLQLPSGQEICERLFLSKHVRDALPEDVRSALPDPPQLEEIKEDWLVLLATAESATVDLELQRAINEVFLQLVRSEYWKMIDAGELNHMQAQFVLRSVLNGIEEAQTGLNDLAHLKKCVVWKYPAWARRNAAAEDGPVTIAVDIFDPIIGSPAARSPQKSERDYYHEGDAAMMPDMSGVRFKRLQDQLRTFIESTPVEVFFGVLVLVNTVFIFSENEHKKDNELEELVRHGQLWHIWLIVFFTFFLVEVILKLVALGKQYFFNGWNLMDLFFVVLGLITIILQGQLMSGGREVSKIAMEIWQIQLIRALHCFRAIRIVRQLPLGKLYLQFKGFLRRREVSANLAECLDIVQLFNAFSVAHCEAQAAMLKFLGNSGDASCIEMARCILESRDEVYQSQALALREAVRVPGRLRAEMTTIRHCAKVVHELSDFVSESNAAGVLTSREADTILHALQDRLKALNQELVDAQEGLLPDHQSSKADSVHRLTAVAGVSTDYGESAHRPTFKDRPPYSEPDHEGTEESDSAANPRCTGCLWSS